MKGLKTGNKVMYEVIDVYNHYAARLDKWQIRMIKRPDLLKMGYEVPRMSKTNKFLEVSPGEFYTVTEFRSLVIDRLVLDQTNLVAGYVQKQFPGDLLEYVEDT